MRDYLNDDTTFQYTTDEVREVLLATIMEEENWLLDGDGDNAPYTEYIKRFTELNRNQTKIKER
jgi:hypothetical protein